MYPNVSCSTGYNDGGVLEELRDLKVQDVEFIHSDTKR